MNFRK